MPSIPISKSQTPLVFDALPALKTRYYQGASRQGHIYTLARLYALKDALVLSLCAFEREPEPESRVGFAIAGANGAVLLLGLSPQAAVLEFRTQGGRESWASPLASYYSGQDEQGWYWGAELTLDAECLDKAGVNLDSDKGFSANLIKYRSDEKAFGSAFPVPPGGGPFQPGCFGRFHLVDY